MDRPLANTYWVIPGKMLAGEYPGGVDDSETRSRLMSLRAARIDSFVDLTEEGELPPYRQMLPHRIRYLRSGIMDTSVPNSVAQTRDLLDYLRRALERDRCLYVHCRAGIGRTGLVIGCYLTDADTDGKRALKELNRLWQQSARALTWPTVPQTREQADYIRRWPALERSFSSTPT